MNNRFTNPVLFAALGVTLLLCVSRRPAFAANPAGELALNTLTDEEQKAGWKLLFDGKTLNGWHGYKIKTPPPSWKVVDGNLSIPTKSKGDPSGNLVTDEQFDSFELSLEWRISPGGNNGVMYRVQETSKEPWHTGPEMQILDNAKHADGKKASSFHAGACYALYGPPKDDTFPAGQWNTARLIVNGNHVEHWLNGQKQVEYEIGSDDWNKKVTASKFKAYPQFAKVPKGHIVLQDHHDPADFRNIKIRVLTSTAPAGRN